MAILFCILFAIKIWQLMAVLNKAPTRYTLIISVEMFLLLGIISQINC